MRLRSLVSSAIVPALMATVAAVAQAQGTLTGTVTAQAGGTPLQEARVFVLGTSISTTTGADGKYKVTRVPVGTAEVRVIRVGYQEQKKSVRILDGQTASLDFVMSQSVVQLQEVVTTATGEQRRVEVGNAVENLSVSKITEAAPIRSISDVLNSRVPGVMVQTGTQTGTGSRVRVRGVSSINLSNDPIYIIDGQRMTSNTGSISFGSGGGNPSRTGDINPEEIENIEIVKGPSAATLYGTDAANGVIVITTKKGRAGAARWTTFAEGGMLEDRNWYPTNYTLAGHTPAGAPLILAQQCSLTMVGAGTCIADSVRTFSPISNSYTTPLGKGNRQAVGIQVAGGPDQVRYFVSAGRDNEIGVFELPEFEKVRYNSLGITPHYWTERPNASLRNSFRGNVSMQVTPQLDAQVNFGYITVDSRFSRESNATVGIGSQAFGGPGYLDTTVARITAPVGTPLWGYRAWTPAYSWEERTNQNVNRTLIGTNINWRPTSWLQARANVGTDLTDRVDVDLNMNGEGAPISTTQRDGFAANNRTNINNITADVGMTANYNPSRLPWMSFKTTVGSQYNNYRLDQNGARGTTLPPGAQSASAGATPNATEGTTMQKTLGIFVEEALGLRDRLFITAAVRTDQNSAFGTKFQRVFYPKLQGSWVISEEDFFPRSMGFGAISNLRLRLAYGASGVQPGANDAAKTFSASSANIKGTDAPIETYNQLGNVNLKPERSAEYEGGFDSRLFSNRVQFDVTYYSRVTHDALISKILAPSLGTGASSQRTNIASIKNAGIEATIGGQLVDRRQLGLDFHIATSANSNRVLTLNGTGRQVGTTSWIVEHYPLNGLWARPILGWEDKDKNGVLTYSADAAKNEVFVGKDTIYRGEALPKYSTSLTSGIDLFNRKLRIQNLFDWRGGNKWYNNTERIRCVSRQNCNGLANTAASFEEQAMVVATLNDPSKTLDGFLQPGAFVKWREASATLTLPDRWAARARARNASLTFSARNVKKWTNYRGSDPESDYQITDDVDTPSEFQTFAAPSYFIFRINLGF